MLRSESGSDVSSSCSEGSADDRSTNRDLVIPSPVELSDSEDDGVSPSQHKLAMMKQLSHKKVPQKSISGSDEEEELVEEQDAEQSIDAQSSTSFDSKSSTAMFFEDYRDELPIGRDDGSAQDAAAYGKEKNCRSCTFI